jgi:hypothetical protein
MVIQEQVARILALTLDSAKHETKAILPPGAPGEIRYQAGQRVKFVMPVECSVWFRGPHGSGRSPAPVVAV